MTTTSTFVEVVEGNEELMTETYEESLSPSPSVAPGPWEILQTCETELTKGVYWTDQRHPTVDPHFDYHNTSSSVSPTNPSFYSPTESPFSSDSNSQASILLTTSTTSSPFQLHELPLCDVCNFTDEELEVLFSFNVCIPSYFSYMPLIYHLYASIFLVALIGNLLVLYTVVSSPKMHTVTNLFIANLAVGDLLITVFCVPFSVASIIVLQYWPFGEGLCIFVNYSQAVSIFVSAYTLVAISLDRYVAIIYPLRPRMTRVQAKIIIAAVWGLALLTTLPIAVVSGLDPTDIRVYQSYGRKVCRERWGNDLLRRNYTAVLMVLQYFLPLLVLIFTYSRIACKVWGCKPLGSPCAGQSNIQMAGLASPDTARGLLRKSTSDHSPAKMIKMTLTVVLVYSLCWLPFNILMVLLDFVEDAGVWPHLHHLWFVFHWLAMSHACYNPIILCWMNTKFREGYLTAMYRLLPCCRRRISRRLLHLRQSSAAGFSRAHTCSTAFGSSRTSRNQRYFEDPERRRESSCSSTGFLHITTDLRMMRPQSSANGLRYNLVERRPVSVVVDPLVMGKGGMNGGGGCGDGGGEEGILAQKNDGLHSDSAPRPHPSCRHVSGESTL